MGGVAAPTHLQDLHHHLLIVGDVDGLKHFAVLAPAQLPDQLVVLLVAMGTERDDGGGGRNHREHSGGRDGRR